MLEFKYLQALSLCVYNTYIQIFCGLELPHLSWTILQLSVKQKQSTNTACSQLIIKSACKIKLISGKQIWHAFQGTKNDKKLAKKKREKLVEVFLAEILPANSLPW